ncbi:hypothetical protein ZWY2020_041842 [Hordeum vulgare]|nr:hypothetical protein ZWY2020_041842 [Hordeum vulgare]
MHTQSSPSPLSPARGSDLTGELYPRSFLNALSLEDPNAEADGARVQAFFAEMEAAIQGHPLWADATHQEIEHALEGLEKYIMTKLFDRTFVSSPKDAATDAEISDKICLLQRFVRPHHLDIPKLLNNEASWLEIKDMKVKADAIKWLMERGYKVKLAKDLLQFLVLEKLQKYQLL